MTEAGPTLAEGLERVLIEVDPDLDYHANWTPAPDPPIEIPIITSTVHWGDVFNWVKDSTRHLLPSGTPISSPSFDEVDQRIDTAQGQMLKALSGYINQSAAMTLQLANLVDEALANVQSNAITDYHDLSTRLDTVQAHNDFIDQYVVPNLQAQITHGTAQAFAFALAAQSNAEDWAKENIFAPVYTELLKVQPAIDASAQSVLNRVPEIVKNLVPTLGLATATGLAALATKVAGIGTEVEECLEPMCDTMGPKTDLGKLLKALKVAEWAALIAEIAALRADGLDGFLNDVQGWAKTAIGDFESAFISGGQTLGETIAGI